MILAEQLIGVWSGSAFPTQETTLVFCPGGQGLLFFHLGSSADTPFVDEFTWSLGTGARLELRWLSRHEYDFGPEGEEADEDQDPDFIVTTGGEESVPVELTEKPTRALRVALGMHGQTRADTWLVYVSAPGSYEAERESLRTLAETLRPFDPDRQAWNMAGDRWSAIRPFFWGQGWLGLNQTRSLLAFLFFGVMGQTLLWAHPILTWTMHRGWILLPLLFFPLFATFREGYFRGRRWYHVCLALEMLLSALYLLMMATGLGLASTAGRPNGLITSTTLLGSVPCLYLLWANPQKWRRDVRADPILAVTFRGWRTWRVHGMNAWLFLTIMTGVVGEMLFLLRLGPPWLTKWPRVLLHCVPALIAVCDGGGLAATIAQKLGALSYFAILALVVTAFVQGWHPNGWVFFAFGIMIGIAPCVYALRKPAGRPTPESSK